jgi:hypothetical protein
MARVEFVGVTTMTAKTTDQTLAAVQQSKRYARPTLVKGPILPAVTAVMIRVSGPVEQ